MVSGRVDPHRRPFPSGNRGNTVGVGGRKTGSVFTIGRGWSRRKEKIVSRLEGVVKQMKGSGGDDPHPFGSETLH